MFIAPIEDGSVEAPHPSIQRPEKSRKKMDDVMDNGLERQAGILWWHKVINVFHILS